jgi:hydroxymethylglutaryl-CoA reductase
VVRSSRLKLRDLDIPGRHDLLAQVSALDQSALAALGADGGLSLDEADHMIENAVGVLGLPIGIACNFTINGRDVLIPMATEEPSVVAAASNAARLARVRGGFRTSGTELLDLAHTQDPMLVGQSRPAADPRPSGLRR